MKHRICKMSLICLSLLALSACGQFGGNKQMWDGAFAQNMQMTMLSASGDAE